MATKWKSWTYHPAVKLLFFCLAVLCVFLEARNVLRLWEFAEEDAWFPPDTTVENYSRNIVENALNNAVEVALFNSEQNIRYGNLLENVYDSNGYLTGIRCRVTGYWTSNNYYYETYESYDAYAVQRDGALVVEWEESTTGEPVAEEEAVFAYSASAVESSDRRETTIVVQQDLSTAARIETKARAIDRQVYTLEDNLSWLRSRDDISFLIKAGDLSYDKGNIDQLAVSASLKSGELETDIPGFSSWISADSKLLGSTYTVIVGIEPATYRALEGAIAASRAAFQNFLITTGVLLLTGILCLVVLTMGAGRTANSGQTVIFKATDTPYLDVGLFLLVIAAVFVGASGIWLQDWIYMSWSFIRAAICAYFALVSIPLLCWYISLVKRIKAGKWWRHTLIFTCLRFIWRGVGSVFRKAVGGIKSFYRDWSSMDEKIKFLITVTATFFLLLLSSVMFGFFLFVFVGVSALLFLHYRNLSRLEQCIEAVEQGEFHDTRTVWGGDYRRIAEKVSGISQGLEQAVSQRLKSERMKTELITNVSHDLRTPLTSMITYTDLLKKDGLDNPRAPEYLEVLIQKTQRLKILTDELFEAAKAASGSLEVNLETLNLSHLIRQSLGELDEQVQSSGLDFRLSLPETAMVRGDGRMLCRVMENLFSNAFKYAMAGSRVYLDLTWENGNWRLEMKNISAAPLNMAPEEFTERFKRGDESRHSEGSGLGLSIVQSFLSAQGGTFAIHIDGDLFKTVIMLPAATEIPAAEQ